MRKLTTLLLSLLVLTACSAQNLNRLVKQSNVERIIRTLSADDMQGRATFSPGIEKAAQFIENEFKEIGLKPLKGQNDFRQKFSKTRIKLNVQDIMVNGETVPAGSVLTITDNQNVNWTES